MTPVSLLWVVVVVLLLLAILGAPGIGVYPASLGYYPSGGITLLVVILLVLLLTGRV